MIKCTVGLLTFCQRGMHDIEHQITYPGCNFIFHDSQGFESGATKELEVVWEFIEARSTKTELKDQLHAIWYLALILYIWLIIEPFLGTAYPWIALVLFWMQNYSFLTKGQEKVSPEVYSLILSGKLPLVSLFLNS